LRPTTAHNDGKSQEDIRWRQDGGAKSCGKGRCRRRYGLGRGAVQVDRNVPAVAAGRVRPERRPVPVGRSGGGVHDTRAAVDAGGTAVPGPSRLSDVRQHGRVGHQRAHVPAQGLHGGGQRGPDVRHAGRDPVRVHRLR